MSEQAHEHEHDGDGRAEAEVRKDPRKTRRTRIIVGAVVAVGVIAALAWWLHARHFEDTDDAQIDANITAVSSRVPGTVVAVHVEDNQPVKAGDLLVELDPADLQVALAQARAAVALAQAQFEAEQPGVPMTETSNRAAVQTAQDELEAARHDLDSAIAHDRFARQQEQRGRMLLNSHTIPQAEYDQRLTAADAAAAAVAAARQRVDQRQAHLAQLRANAPRQLTATQAGLTVREANLRLAQAQLKQAELNVSYARIVAPVAGIAGKRSVNVGDRVQPGQELLSITQTEDLWVTANFRETQIENMKAGQKASVHVDALSRDYDATVESFAGATGARYSLMPPENASGNYVKVVQRIPVRLRLAPGQPDMERLRPGMSVEPKVRVR
jgi:membrane fusion protein (multidrug efflux system)